MIRPVPLAIPLSGRRSLAPTEDDVGSISCSTEHRVGQMTVDVGRRGDARVAEDARHHGQFLALLQAEGRASVAQIMEALVGESCGLESGVEAVRDVGRIERLTRRCREQRASVQVTVGSPEREDLALP